MYRQPRQLDLFHRDEVTSQTSGSIFSRSYRFVALDVETANADRGSICQLGLALVDHDGAIQTASFMIDP